jgi:hypothetical protein
VPANLPLLLFGDLHLDGCSNPVALHPEDLAYQLLKSVHPHILPLRMIKDIIMREIEKLLL